MDDLLTAIVERQSAMRAEMRPMHGAQMPQTLTIARRLPTDLSIPDSRGDAER
jgi:hypothetical protein